MKIKVEKFIFFPPTNEHFIIMTFVIWVCFGHFYVLFIWMNINWEAILWYTLPWMHRSICAYLPILDWYKENLPSIHVFSITKRLGSCILNHRPMVGSALLRMDILSVTEAFAFILSLQNRHRISLRLLPSKILRYRSEPFSL